MLFGNEDTPCDILHAQSNTTLVATLWPRVLTTVDKTGTGSGADAAHVATYEIENDFCARE